MNDPDDVVAEESASILILDDNRHFADNLAELATLEGHRPTLAYSIREAREHLERGPFTVAILDQRLTDGIGTDFLRELRQRLPDVVAVIITAYSTFETTVDALHEGAFALVTKDSDPEDILGTLRRAVETARLRRENRTLRVTQDALFQAVPDILILVDGSMRVRVVNARHPLFCDVEPDQAVGRRLEEVLRKDVWKDHDWVSVLRGTGEPLLRITVDQETRSFGVRAVKLPVKPATLTLLRITDNTEVMDLQERLGEAERLASLGRMASSIAHQLRNPIAGIRALAQTLDSRFPEGDDDHDVVAEIIRLTDRANATFADLLQFARPSRSEPQPVSVIEMIEDVVREVSHGDRNGQPIQIQVDPRIQVHVTRDRILGAMASVVENALDAAGNGPISIRTRTLDDACVVEIEDSGSGVESSDAELIFEPFFTRKTRGTGLGLFIARKAVEDDGGTVRVGRSEELGGARFEIHLPRSPHD